MTESHPLLTSAALASEAGSKKMTESLHLYADVSPEHAFQREAGSKKLGKSTISLLLCVCW